MDSQVPANGSKRVRPGRRLSLRQVVDLQHFSFEAAKGLSDDFQGTSDREERARVASAICNLAKGWVSLQDAKREILGKPKAGVRKKAVEKKPKDKPYWEMQPIFSEEPPPDAQPEQNKPPGDEVKWEMREGPPGVFTQVVTDSPAIRAAAAGASPAGPPAPPPMAKREPADIPCGMCGGKGSRRNSNFGVDLKCPTCKGTGRLPGAKIPQSSPAEVSRKTTSNDNVTHASKTDSIQQPLVPPIQPLVARPGTANEVGLLRAQRARAQEHRAEMLRRIHG